MSQDDKGGSAVSRLDWSAIARNPKFLELSRKKSSFLLGWWLVSTIFYFILPIAAGYATEQSSFLNQKVIGPIPLGYLFALSQYGLCLFIAIYYAYWANKHADKLTRELLDELKLK
jgi:uncharacterized membrane protein (DUF485 family)